MLYFYQTERLELRVLDVSAAPMVLDFCLRNREDFEKWDCTHTPEYYTLSYQQQTLIAEHRLMMTRRALRFYIFLKELSDTPIGSVSFSYLSKEDQRVCTLGYKLDAAYRHFGYAYEAISCLLPHIAAEFGITTFEADIQPANTSSVALVKKLGFEPDPIPLYTEAGTQHGEKKLHIRFFLTYEH